MKSLSTTKKKKKKALFSFIIIITSRFTTTKKSPHVFYNLFRNKNIYPLLFSYTKLAVFSLKLL